MDHSSICLSKEAYAIRILAMTADPVIVQNLPQSVAVTTDGRLEKVRDAGDNYGRQELRLAFVA